MGNAGSCASSIISTGVVKVLPFNGNLRLYANPAKAGELMLENQGYFVCDTSSLKVGRRIYGLLAEEELERRQFYFLLPMELLYSVLTDEELSSLSYRATKALKQATRNNFGKIFPVLSEFCPFPSKPKELDNPTTYPALESVERC